MATNRWNVERFLQEVELLPDKDEYIFSEYENINRCDSKFTVQCKKCNHIWQASCDNFVRRGTRCYVCKLGVRWSMERFLREVSALLDANDYFFSEFEKINGYSSKFKVQCKKCNHVWLATPDNFFRCGKRCYVCNCGEKWTEERVIKEFSLLEDKDNYILYSNSGINGVSSKFHVKCRKCNKTWETNSMNFFHSNTRCPNCISSKGEQQISRFLCHNKIKFEPQKKFDTCKDKYVLRFDFYLPAYELLIEFNGIQHYTPVCFGKTNDVEVLKEKLVRCQTRDEIKRQWSIENGYRFLIIKYDEIDKIEEILTKELNL